MLVDAVLGALSRIELFQGLNLQQLGAISRCAQRVTIAPGQAIITDGDVGDSAFLLVSGEAVRWDSSEEDEAELIETGSLMGEMAMLVEVEHSSTIVARTAVRALKISRAALLETFEDQPDLAEHLAGALSGRLRTMADTLQQIDRLLAGEASAPPHAPRHLLAAPPRH